MAKPETLKDLMQSGDLSRGELDKIAKAMFRSDEVVNQAVVPYRVFLPNFEDLPLHVQGFIAKALLECKVMNVLDWTETVEGLSADTADDEYDLE